MKKRGKTSIATSLKLAFAVIVLIAAGVGVLGIITVSGISGTSERLFENYGNAQGYLGFVLGEFQKQSMLLKDISIDENNVQVERTSSSIQESDVVMMDYLGRYGVTCEDKTGYQNMSGEIEEFRQARDKVLQLGIDGSFQKAYMLLKSEEYNSAQRGASDAIGAAMAEKVSEAAGLLSSQSASQSMVIVIMIGIVVAAVVIAVVFSLLLSRSISRKVYWYESLLDSIPFPISVTDMKMNWTFINKPVEDMLGIKRKDVLGKQCDNWNADICNTERCGIARLRNGDLQTRFKQTGMDFQVDTSYITDPKGKRIGHIEVVQDITARVRSAEYSRVEVEKIAANLKKLADGHLTMTFDVADGDQYTENEKRNFTEINDNFRRAVESFGAYMAEISRALGEMAGGDLTVSIDSEFKGDFVVLKDSINHIAESLNSVLADIGVAADQVASGTRQVSDGSQQISQGATEQSSAIEQLTDSVSRIAEQTRQNAMSANQANELTTLAADDAARGNESMQMMQQAMDEISEASRSISKIIKVIDDIAFQTNILALNAAVEAARAGAHGKGFAVVAEEVRNLAARSAAAAKETTGLIEGSIQKTGAGTRIADETAAALGSIVEGVQKAAELVSEIASASGEQATAIAQVDRGIEQMSQVVQTNSATSEETAAAAEELSSQAEMLKSKVGQFIIRHESEISAPEAIEQIQAPAAPVLLPPEFSDGGFGKY